MVLIPDYILHANILTDLASWGHITWFENMTWSFLIQNFVLPIVGLIFLAFYLKNHINRGNTYQSTEVRHK